jgi:hypothetical protein
MASQFDILRDSHKSLRNLCEHAKDAPLGYSPNGWSPSERAIWCMGFCEAMTMVLAYIDGKSLPHVDPQSGTRNDPPYGPG